MEEQRHIAVHHIIRAVILGGFSFYVVHLVKMDKLQYYLAPRMMPYIKYSAVALFLLAAYYVYMALQSSDHKHEHDADCDCGHEPPRSLPKNMAIYSVFLLPLLFGFLFPDKIMGSDVASVKGMNLTVKNVQQPIKKASVPSAKAATEKTQSVQNTSGMGSSTADTTSKPSLDDLFPYDEYTKDFSDLGKIFYTKDIITVKDEGFLEYISTLDLYRHNFIGKTVVLSGFVYREENMAANQFAVSRMAVSCCTADAEPYGIMAEWSKAADLSKDTWITLTGNIGLKEYNGNEIIVLNTRKVTTIHAPKDPYVYPYFGDITELEKK
ncbi:TIGR03943 family putative permease subunit [Paenibacillus sp. MMO-58]|uniref:TIGR03943 family putative permease subunit n=1 Tax=Paenibacillus sp. MMO-58 TaxID=3081290 RepID=UPI003017664B